MKYFGRRSLLQDVRAKSGLVVVMIGIGTFTIFASANTYEVIVGDDVPLSSVITTVQLTSDQQLDKKIKSDSATQLDEGSFGLPQKIKLPETKQHIEIVSGGFNNNGWKAKAGFAQEILVANAEQKVFGKAVIYMRYNTSTTQHLGNVLVDDVINIVTTDGWQLGYSVTQTADTLGELNTTPDANKSRIFVVMINDDNGKTKCFQASLAKVGERI